MKDYFVVFDEKQSLKRIFALSAAGSVVSLNTRKGVSSLFALAHLIAFVYKNKNNVTKKRQDAAFDWSKFYFVVPVNSEENPALKTWLKFTVLARTNLGP